jgi:hypothetical protein
MSDRVRRPLKPPADHQSMGLRKLSHPEPLNRFQINLLMRDEIGRSTQGMIEDSRASRSPARRLYPTAEDRARLAKAPAKPEAPRSPNLSQDRGAVSPLGGLAN